jgi:GntR family transcriptional regulator
MSTGPAFSPLYRQIKLLLVRSLEEGEWKPGEAIPSETDLAQRFRVSQGTVRKAIDALADDNLVVRRQGKGTFVATHAEEKIQYRFLRLAPDDGRPRGMARHFLDCRRIRPAAPIARALEVKGAEGALLVRRTLSQDTRPVVLDEIWLPAGLFRGLTAERLASYEGPMYSLFESEFGVRMIRAEEKIRAVAADAGTAGLLEVAEGSPLLCVERLSFTYGDRPVEFRRGLYRTDRHHYRNTLS